MQPFSLELVSREERKRVSLPPESLRWRALSFGSGFERPLCVRKRKPNHAENMVIFLMFTLSQDKDKENQLKSLIMAQIERWRHG